MAVTVVVATYRRPEALARCLDALGRGSHQPDAVLVQDQSPDSLTRLAVARYPNVIYRHSCPPNASVGRQAGLLAAPTPLVAFTDDDCIPAPAWLDSLLVAYAEGSADAAPIAAVSGRILPYGGRSGIAVSSRTGTVRRTFRAYDGALDRAAWAPWDAGSGGNLLVDRSLAITVGGWDPSLGPGTRARAGEDIDLLYRLARVGTLIYTPTALVYHAPVTRRSRLARRYPYGRGMGAVLAKHLIARDPAAPALLSLYVRHQAAAAFRTAWGPVEAPLTCLGLVSGLLGHRLWSKRL